MEAINHVFVAAGEEDISGEEISTVDGLFLIAKTLEDLCGVSEADLISKKLKNSKRRKTITWIYKGTKVAVHMEKDYFASRILNHRPYPQGEEGGTSSLFAPLPPVQPGSQAG